MWKRIRDSGILIIIFLISFIFLECFGRELGKIGASSNSTLYSTYKSPANKEQENRTRSNQSPANDNQAVESHADDKQTVESHADDKPTVESQVESDSTNINDSASAEDAYEIHSAHFYVYLNDDGSADFTEIWSVSPKSQFSMTFIRNINKSSDLAERFDNLTDLSVSINEQHVERMDNDSEQGYTLSITGINSYAVNVYTIPRQGINSIVIRYRLNNIVKYTDVGYYLFSHLFFGDNDQKEAGETNIFIYPPKGSEITLVNAKDENGKIKGFYRKDDKGVSYSTGSTVGRLQFTMHIYGSDIFHGITPITYVKEENNIHFDFSMAKYLLIPVLLCFCIYVIKAENYNFHRYIKRNNVWGKSISYHYAYSLTKNAIDELFYNMNDKGRRSAQSDYERAIRCAFSCGAENPMSILFAALLMMASENEAELKKDEIWFSSSSLVKRKTKIDMGVRVFLNTFKTEDIPGRPGWVKVCLKTIMEEMGSDNPDTVRHLRLIWRKTSRIMSSNRVRYSGKARSAVRQLRKSSAYYSAAYKAISMDEMVRSVVKRNLTPRKLFEFMYLENVTRSMGDLSYIPSKGEYVLYDFLFSSLFRRSAELYTVSPVRKIKL